MTFFEILTNNEAFLFFEVIKGTLYFEFILEKISAASFMNKGQNIEFSLVNDSLKRGYEDWKDSICGIKK